MSVSQYGKKFVKMSAIVGRFGPPGGWTEYFVFRFAFTYCDSARWPGRVARPSENEIDRAFWGVWLALTENFNTVVLSLVSYGYTNDVLILPNNGHWGYLVYRQFQCHIIQAEGSLDGDHTYAWLDPDHGMLATSGQTDLALDLRWLPNCRGLAQLTTVRAYFW